MLIEELNCLLDFCHKKNYCLCLSVNHNKSLIKKITIEDDIQIKNFVSESKEKKRQTCMQRILDNQN